ncbi:hypothetical protein [Rhodococcus sp. HS-D2]|uniref:hypothetical protein n=1 Tax=Rhodococcus sp. HS-D2 TaxID=1384636 RepID=UPI0007D99756|nr:hypothetical protein [Rhodococcus sp. HS-D2]
MLEAFGFLVLCASLSAAHTTDYLVSWGTAVLVAREEASRMLDVCTRAGLMEETVVDGVQMWKIVEDPEFLHMRTAEEVAWERQRKSDNSNPELIVPVRLRDGDACRYCGQVVKWTARKGRLAGTYDHRVPGRAATIDTMVVSCGRCNSARKDNPAADEQHPLLPAPARPYFSPETRKWIAEHDWAKSNGYSITSRRGKTLPPGTVPDDRKTVVERTQRSGSQPENATPRPDGQSDHAPTATRDDGQRNRTNTQRSGSQPENATPRPDGQSDHAPTATRDDGQRNRTNTQRSGSQPENATPRPDGQSDHAPTATRDDGQRNRTNTQRSGSQPENATPRPDTQSDNADPQRPTSQADNANMTHPTTPAQTPDLLSSAGPAEDQPPTSGKAGTGRGGSGRVGNQTSHSDRNVPSRSRSLPKSSSPRRGRRGKNRKTGA